MQGKDIILGILSKKERSGYEINDILQNQLSYFYDGTYGMIYPTLRKLEKDGKITKEVVIQDGRPNKNIYAITESGKKELASYLQSDVNDEIYQGWNGTTSLNLFPVMDFERYRTRIIEHGQMELINLSKAEFKIKRKADFV